jgi:hypothetical protein
VRYPENNGRAALSPTGRPAAVGAERLAGQKIMAFWQIFLATYYRYGLATLILDPTLNLMLLDVRWLQFLLKRPAHK